MTTFKALAAITTPKHSSLKHQILYYTRIVNQSYGKQLQSSHTTLSHR